MKRKHDQVDPAAAAATKKRKPRTPAVSAVSSDALQGAAPDAQVLPSADQQSNTELLGACAALLDSDESSSETSDFDEYSSNDRITFDHEDVIIG